MGNNSFNLLCVGFQRAVGPDDEIGVGDLFPDWPLGGDALLDLLWRPAALQKSLALMCRRTGDTDGFVKTRFAFRFKQQWNHGHGQWAILPAPGFNLRQPARLDARVQNGFKFFAGSGVRKNNLRQFIPAQLGAGGDNVPAKNRLDFRQSRLARFNQLVRQFVGIHDLCAAFAEKLGGDGLAHANAAG